MPACERFDDRARVHPCAAHRHVSADHQVLTAVVQYVPEWDLQVIPCFLGAAVTPSTPSLKRHCHL